YLFRDGDAGDGDVFRCPQGFQAAADLGDRVGDGIQGTVQAAEKQGVRDQFAKGVLSGRGSGIHLHKDGDGDDLRRGLWLKNQADAIRQHDALWDIGARRIEILRLPRWNKFLRWRACGCVSFGHQTSNRWACPKDTRRGMPSGEGIYFIANRLHWVELDDG